MTASLSPRENDSSAAPLVRRHDLSGEEEARATCQRSSEETRLRVQVDDCWSGTLLLLFSDETCRFDPCGL
jgi:hypothetical protein